jgi:putative tricarboxylic transport membrane protein
MTAKPAWDDTLLGVIIVGFAAIVAWQTSVIPLNAIYAKVGPNVIPWLLSGMLGVLGLVLTVIGLRGGWQHEDAPGELDLPAIAWLGGGLALNVGLIELIGFILSSTLLFVFTARAFKSTSPLRDTAIGFVLALVSYVGFDRLLGYKIGSGLIERLI